MMLFGLKTLLFYLFIFVIYTSCDEIEISNGYDDENEMHVIDEETILTDLKNFIENGELSNELTIALQSLNTVTSNNKPVKSYTRNIVPFIQCIACEAAAGYLLFLRRNYNQPKETLAGAAIAMCQVINPLFSLEVCTGYVNLNIDTLLNIYDSRPLLNKRSFCSLVLQPDCGPLDPALEFIVNIAPLQARSASKFLSNRRQKSTTDMKVIQFTDIHYDPSYVVGAYANCNDPFCCRKPASKHDNKAGYWGDYGKCDMPLHTLKNALEYIAQQNADIIYFTGDVVPHNSWETTVQNNIEIIDGMYQLINKTFGNTKFYPVLGNHEAHPSNHYVPSANFNPQFSSFWLYNLTVSLWGKFLPNETFPTILKGGYYTVLVKPGFRVIGLNSMHCYIYNWWVLYSVDEAREQLQWLHDTLLAAERNNEKVHILSHIPNNHETFKYCSREYRRIIERFHKIISAQFNGHSHSNEFNVFYETNNISNPINVAWKGGSLTTYVNFNPNFNVYYVNGNDLQVSDYEAWIFNITEANQNMAISPRWYKQFSFKSTYNVPDLSPTSLDSLQNSMIKTRSIAKLYFKQKVKDGDPFLKDDCSDDCLRENICKISINEAGDDRKCKEMLKNSFTSD